MAQNDIYSAINAIPIAEDGHIITREYHNSLRSGLILIANQLGVTPVSQTVTMTFAPSFLQNGLQPGWLLNNGYASNPSGGAAQGWFLVQLPDAVRIQSMTVMGRRTGNTPSFQVQLLRQPINEIDITVLIAISLRDATDPFTATGTLQVPGAGPSALEEYRIVDNENYKYLVFARLIGAASDSVVEIRTIKLTFNRA